MAVQPTLTSPPTSANTSISRSQSDDTLATIDSARALESRIDESDLDPAAFLKSVRELSEKREREDVERVRKLEEEIESGRRERARRREERARSISPEKVDASQPRPLTSRLDSYSVVPPSSSTPQTSSSPATMDGDAAVPKSKGFGSVSKSSASTYSTKSTEAGRPAQSASSLARSGTLSWQRRPASREADSRPQSVVSGEGREPTNTPPIEGPEKSREQIAASLGSKDPSWFKQTADRGIGNAAYRRSRDEAGGDGMEPGRRALPGMSRKVSAETTRQGSPAPSESVRSDTTSHPSTERDSTFSSTRFSASRTSTSSKPDLKSLIAADEGQEKASPRSNRTSSVADSDHTFGVARTLTMSSSQARLANAQDRPISPTKGMGGFVSSAMMKRADSQSKRWSAQPGGSLSRQGSLASARSGYGGLQGSHSMPKFEPTPSSRERNDEPASRPTSSNNNPTNLTGTEGREDKDGFVKPALPSHSRSKSVTSSYSTSAAEDGHASPPSSPSKRWSPTKSSWLESAITKPESPKPAPTRTSQPDWMANIARVKAQRTGGETVPKAEEEAGFKPASPTKATFGQGMLKRSESGGLGTASNLTSKPPDAETPRSTSSAKAVFSQNPLQRSDSRDLQDEPGQSTPLTKSRPLEAMTEPTLSLQMRPTSKMPASEPSDVTMSAEEKALPKTEEAKKQATSVKSPPPSINRPKPETASKPQTDFRSTLRSRPPAEVKQNDQPEFLAKFGQLRKAETKNYVAPDLLKDNILRGKGDLTKTGGPVKTAQRDEFKEGLLAKKEQWKKEKEEGIVHERKTSNPPVTPSKPEALAKREMMNRTGSVKQSERPEKPETATPEALAKHKGLKEKPRANEVMPLVTKQKSEPTGQSAEIKRELPRNQTSTSMTAASPPTITKQMSETSKLASRFNPALASMLAKGPPALSSTSNAPSRSESPALPQGTETQSEPHADGAALQDLRKGRAKGPKKRKGGAKEVEVEVASPTPAVFASQAEPTAPTKSEVSATEPAVETPAILKSKPRAPPGAAASIMTASLQKSPPPEPEIPQKGKSVNSIEASKPVTPAKSPSGLNSERPIEDKPELISSTTTIQKPALSGARAMQAKPTMPAKTPQLVQSTPSSNMKALESPQTEVPDFKGFGSMKRSKPSPASRLAEDNKENVAEASPSVKSAASLWGRQSSPKRTETPDQIKLPSKKDEEAAMRSAGLLASSPSRPNSTDALGIAIEQSRLPAETPLPSAGRPAKPAKSSRSVSGQLIEASPNKGPADSHGELQNATEQRLHDVFGSLPKSSDRLSIDTLSAITSEPHQERIFKTIRQTVHLVSPEGVLRQLPQHQNYTFFDECVHVFSHAYSIANGPKKAEIFLWIGNGASQVAVDQAHTAAKKLAKSEGNAYVATVRQGFEPPGFLQALGGILITRRGSPEGVSKQYMLRGRQHLGQITFDEVNFGVSSLCCGFAYLISYPVSLSDTKLYLWKGSAASPEEVSAARLAAMDLGETGEIIEVDGRAEFSSFLRIFGPGTTKASIQAPSEFWQAKALQPSRFHSRLFKIQKAEQKTGGGMFGSFFARRPSWNSATGNGSPTPLGGMRVEAKEISPFTQHDLEAESIYLLDAWSAVYILVGPVFPSQPETARNSILAQALLFVDEYVVLAASTEHRPAVPTAEVVLAGVPNDVSKLFRFWDEGLGLWGTGGLMAGSAAGREGLVVLKAEEVKGAICGSGGSE